MASLVPHADALARAPPKEVVRLVDRIRSGLKASFGEAAAGGAGEDKRSTIDDDVGELARSCAQAVKTLLRNSGADAASGRLDTAAAVACLELLVDVLRQGGSSVADLVADALPEVVGCVAADAVRPAAVDLMVEHVRAARNPKPVALALLGRGLTHEVGSVRAHAAAIVPLVLLSGHRRSSGPPDFRRIIEGLAGCLRDPEPTVVEASLRSLGRVQSVTGERDFDKQTKKLSYAHQQYVNENSQAIKHFASQRSPGKRSRAARRVLSTGDDSDASSGVTSPTTGLVALHSPMGVSARGISSEPDFATIERVGASGPVRGGAVSPRTALANAGSARSELEASRRVEFGFVPGHVVDELGRGTSTGREGGGDTSGSTDGLEMRATAAAELLAAARRASSTDPAVFSTALGPLLRFIASVVGDSVYKIANAGLQVLEIVAECCGGSMRPHLDLILPTLTKKLGDNKVVIREAAMKALSRLMHVVGSTSVLPTLLACASDHKWHVREATLSMITLALLTNSRLRPFNYDVVNLVRTLSPLLSDPKLEVRHTADHMFAVLQKAEGGAADILAMLGTLGHAPSSEPMQRLAARLRDQQLPSVNADGLVTFPPLKPQASQVSTPQAAAASPATSGPGGGGGAVNFAPADGASAEGRAGLGSGSVAESASPKAGVSRHHRRPSAGRAQHGRIPFEIPRTRAGSGSRRAQRETPTPTEEHMPPNPFASGRSFVDETAAAASAADQQNRRGSYADNRRGSHAMRSQGLRQHRSEPGEVAEGHVQHLQKAVSPDMSPPRERGGRAASNPSPTLDKSAMSVHVPEDAHRDMAAYKAALELDPESPERRTLPSIDGEVTSFGSAVRDRSRPIRAGVAGGGPSAGDARAYVPVAPSPVTAGRQFVYETDSHGPYTDSAAEIARRHPESSNGEKIALWLPEGQSSGKLGSGSASSVAGSSSDSIVDGSLAARPAGARAGRRAGRRGEGPASSGTALDMSISAPNTLGAALSDAAAANGEVPSIDTKPDDGQYTGIAGEGRARARTDFGEGGGGSAYDRRLRAQTDVGPSEPTGFGGRDDAPSPSSVRGESPRARLGRRALQQPRSQSAHPASPDKLGVGDPAEMKTRLALLKGRNRGAGPAGGRRAASASSRVEGGSGSSTARDEATRRPPRTSAAGALTPDPKSSSRWDTNGGSAGGPGGLHSPDPDDRPIRPMRNAFAAESETGSDRGPSLTVDTGEERPIRPLAPSSSPDIYEKAAMSEDAYVPSAAAAGRLSRGSTPRVSRATLAARERREKARSAAVSPVNNPRRQQSDGVVAMRSLDVGNRSPRARRLVEASPARSPAVDRRRRGDSEADGSGPRTPAALPSSKGQEITYMETSELQPLRNPDAEARRVVSGLRNSGWETEFRALDTLRSLAIHHSDKIVGNLHTIILSCDPLVNNLRSAVSRNCLLAYADLFTGLGTALDPELDTMVPQLLARSADSLRILCTCASAALDRMVECCTPLRCVNSLLNCLDHRNSVVRQRVGEYLDACVEKMGSRIIGTREADRVVTAAVKLAGEGREEARRAGKAVVYRLADIGMLDERFIRSLSDKIASKLRSILEKRPRDFAPASFAIGGAGGSAGPRATSRGAAASRAGAARSARRTRKAAGSATFDGGSQPEELKNILGQLGTSDWRERQGGLERLVAYCNDHRRVVVANSYAVADQLSQCLADGNHKVIAAAARTLTAVLPVLKDHIEGSVPQILQPLATNTQASQRAVAEGSRAALDSLMSLVDCRSLVLPIVSLVSHGNSKVKVIMTEKLAELVPDVYYKKAAMIEKHVLPALLRHLGESRTDMRNATSRAIEVTARCIGGPAVMEAAATIPAAHQDRLRSILGM